ncbi:TPA: NUDIX hydrolase [Bacillus cereus]|uniref:NUDIX hydrolase n=1 Tax=unclassified Bacillus (in: firmicutes) TaxID=185979 RepID=UPI0008FE9207|nr:NUDIX hydrolase [Bacillus sp. N35-10-4]OJD67399.1 DNA mismatch repair protein MutT [Bacillus sp. N35-10-4]
MERWISCAAVCVNERNEVLMVLQGQKGEEKRWSIPSGGLEKGETLEECCIREVWEETGYNVEVVSKIYEKEGITYGVSVYVHYYVVKKIGGSMKIQDPDELIHEIAWKRIDEMKELTLSFPEDYEILNKYINKKASV